MLPMSAPVLLPQSGKALDIDAAVDALVLGKPNRLHRGAAVQGESAQGRAVDAQELRRLLLGVEQRGGPPRVGGRCALTHPHLLPIYHHNPNPHYRRRLDHTTPMTARVLDTRVARYTRDVTTAPRRPGDQSYDGLIVQADLPDGWHLPSRFPGGRGRRGRRRRLPSRTRRSTAAGATSSTRPRRPACSSASSASSSPSPRRCALAGSSTSRGGRVIPSPAKTSAPCRPRASRRRSTSACSP